MDPILSQIDLELRKDSSMRDDLREEIMRDYMHDRAYDEIQC